MCGWDVRLSTDIGSIIICALPNFTASPNSPIVATVMPYAKKRAQYRYFSRSFMNLSKRSCVKYSHEVVSSVLFLSQNSLKSIANFASSVSANDTPSLKSLIYRYNNPQRLHLIFLLHNPKMHSLLFVLILVP